MKGVEKVAMNINTKILHFQVLKNQLAIVGYFLIKT